MTDSTVEAETNVLKTLAKRSPCHVTDIANSVENHPITIERTCTRLHEEGCIYPLGRGLYEITEDGERRLEARRDH